MILVLAAPSGAGKTSLAQALVDRRPDLVFSLSATTRPPRAGETDGVDYRFVDDAGFDRLLADRELLEWAHVHDWRYGTLRSGVLGAIEEGSSVVLDIDVQGARLIRETLPAAVLVFVLPPSIAEMKRRLLARGSENERQLATRMRTARGELDAVDAFDHVIINDDFEQAIDDIEAILSGRSMRGREEPLQELLGRLRADMDEILNRSS